MRVDYNSTLGDSDWAFAPYPVIGIGNNGYGEHYIGFAFLFWSLTIFV